MNATLIMIAAMANLLLAYRKHTEPLWLLVHATAALYLMTRLAN